MKLFILYQTDQWKSKASRVFFGIFDCRNKALDFAKYHTLSTRESAVLVLEVELNQFGEM
jgi:hypothetical protein